MDKKRLSKKHHYLPRKYLKGFTDNKNGFLFDSLKGLKKLTIKTANDENQRKKLALEAQKRAKDFRKEIFFEKLNEIIK